MGAAPTRHRFGLISAEEIFRDIKQGQSKIEQMALSAERLREQDRAEERKEAARVAERSQRQREEIQDNRRMYGIRKQGKCK